jgi:hypothetical protein
MFTVGFCSLFLLDACESLKVLLLLSSNPIGQEGYWYTRSYDGLSMEVCQHYCNIFVYVYYEQLSLGLAGQGGY